MYDIDFIKTRTIPILPENPENASYEIFNNLVKAHINKNVYTLTEVKLNEKEQEDYRIVKENIIEEINFAINESNSIDSLNKTLNNINQELHLKLTEEGYKKIFYLLYLEFLGLWKLEPLLQDPLIKKFICKNNDFVYVLHQFYGPLKTNILIDDSDFTRIERKLSIMNEEQKINFKLVLENNNLEISKRPLETPLSLLQNKQATPEMLALLWILIEYRKPLLFTDDFLNIANFFLPPETRVLTNTDLNINKDVTYSFGGKSGDEDFVLLNNVDYQGQASKIMVSKNISEKYFSFFIENKVILKIIERGSEILAVQENKIKNSIFLNTKELEKELSLRAKLLTILQKNRLNPVDFRKVISVYYHDRTTVLKRVRLI